MPDRGPGSALRVQTGPGQAFEVVQHCIDLLRGRAILRRPGNDTGREAVFELQGVGNLTDAEWISA